MSEMERWQLAGSAPEVYADHLVPAIFGPWVPVVLDSAQLREGQSVLDVACGTGAVAAGAAARVGATGAVTGVDNNPGMLAVASARSRHEVRWQEADAQMLPFPDRSFDRVICQLGLQYFPDRLAAVREMHRVLHPGGPAHPGLPARHIRLRAAIRPDRPGHHRRRRRVPRAGGHPGRPAGPQPGLPSTAGRKSTRTRSGGKTAAAGRLPRRRTRHHETQLLQPIRALPPAAARVRLQAQASANTVPPVPPSRQVQRDRVGNAVRSTVLAVRADRPVMDGDGRGSLLKLAAQSGGYTRNGGYTRSRCRTPRR